MHHGEMKRYAVFVGSSRVTSVGARNKQEAIQRAADVLNRPGRYEIYRAWVDGGRKVVEV